MRKIERTEDGSTTIYVEELDEHYHSIKGAMTESEHIFVSKGLKSCNKKDITILEVGFGTGLNALLTAMEAQKGQKIITYISLEKYPLEWEQIQQLGYPNEQLLKEIHLAEWDKWKEITPNFIIKKIKCDVPSQLNEVLIQQNCGIDVVYFDAFAPEKQPQMWSNEIFKTIYDSMNHNGILTTYCAKGCIRRLLQDIGFKMERLEGPPGGKREILRGTKL